MDKPDITDMDLDGPTYYLDVAGRPWTLIGRQRQPTLILQRTDCMLHPMDMPRHSIVPSSNWAQENWTRVSADHPQVRALLIKLNGGR